MHTPIYRVKPAWPMRSTILTILPHPSERQVGIRPALTGATSLPGTEAQTHPAGGSRGPLPSIESVLLEKLLDEVEARRLARVQPTYVIEQPPAARQTILIRTLWSLLWALSMVVCVFSVKYIDSQTMLPRVDAGQSRALESLTASLGNQEKEFSTMIDSLHGLTGVIALSSTRTAAIPDMLKRLGDDLQQSHSPLIRQPIGLSAEPPTPAQEADAAQIPMGGHHHSPIDVATVAPPGASVHHNSVGVMDYWLVPRVVSGVQTMVKVVPISQNNGASFVHHVAEAKDYILTSSGDWIAVSEATGNK